MRSSKTTIGGISKSHIVSRCRGNALRVTIFLIFCFTPSCRDAVSPVARSLAVPPVIARDMQALAPTSVQLPANPGTTVYMTSFPYVEQILVEASITGLIHVTSDPAGGGPWVNADFDYKGVWDAGMYQCDWSALITTPQATVPLGACSPSGYTQVSEWRDTILLGGIGGNEVVNARRGGGPGAPQYCPNGNLCHVATGSQTVTVTPLAADIDLRGFLVRRRAEPYLSPLSPTPKVTKQSRSSTRPTPNRRREFPCPFAEFPGLGARPIRMPFRTLIGIVQISRASAQRRPPMHLSVVVLTSKNLGSLRLSPGLTECSTPIPSVFNAR